MLNGTIERIHTPAGDAPPPEVPLQVWAVNPLVKVFPDTPPQAQAKTIYVELARNEYEPVQLAVRGRFGAANPRVQVAVSTLRNADGAALPPVKVERVGFVPVDHPSAYYSTDVPDWCRKVPKGSRGHRRLGRRMARPAHARATRSTLEANRTQPLWFTVQRPAPRRAGHLSRARSRCSPTAPRRWPCR